MKKAEESNNKLNSNLSAYKAGKHAEKKLIPAKSAAVKVLTIKHKALKATIAVISIIIAVMLANINGILSYLTHEQTVENNITLNGAVTATFQSDNNIIEEKVVFAGDKIGALPTCTKELNIFNGWYTDETGGTQITENTVVNSNTTYYAHWTPANYAEYDGNGIVNVYATLQEALANATSGNTIKLLTQSLIDSSSSAPSIEANKTLTFDLNGNSVLLSNSIANSGNLTITDSSATQEKPEGNGKLQAVNNCITNNGAGTLTVNSGTIQTSGKGSGHTYSVIDQNSTGTVTINNGKIISNDLGIAVNSTGKVTINNGEITSNEDDAIHCYGTNNQLEINNGTITGAICGVHSTGTTNINGGTITATNGVGVYAYSGTLTLGTNEATPSVNTTNPSITGTTYGVRVFSGATFNFYDGVIKGQLGQSIVNGSASATMPSNVPTGYVVVYGTEVIDGTTYEKAYLGLPGTGNYAEYVGNNATQVREYETLQNAFIRGENNNTIKPLKGTAASPLIDASASRPTIGSSSDSSKSLKLDMAGHVVEISQYIENFGTLDIYSSVDGGKLYRNGTVIIANRSTGTLTTNGTSSSNTLSIVNTSTTSNSTQSVIQNEGNLTLNTNTTLTYENASTEGTQNRYIIMNANGTTTVNGATLTNTIGGTTKEYGISNTSTATNARIVVNSGTVEASAYAIWNNGSEKNTTTEPAVKIAGGEVKSTGNSAVISGVANSMIYVTGGTISSTTTTGTSVNTVNTNGNFTMEGGTIYAYSGSGVNITGNGVGIVSGGLISKEKNPVTNTWVGGAALNISGSASATLSGTAVVRNANGNGSNVIYNASTGTLTVDGATVQNLGAVRTAYNASSGKILVKSGTITSAGGHILANGYASGTEVSHGTIEIQGGTLSTTSSTGIANTCNYGEIIVSGGSITSAGNNGTIYNTAENAKITVTGGDITATASSAIYSNVATSTVTIGTDDGTVTSSATAKPCVSGGINGVYAPTATFNFYDGVIIGQTGKSCSKEPDSMPAGYGRKITYDSVANTETSTLDNKYRAVFVSNNLMEGKTLNHGTASTDSFSGPTNGVYTGTLTTSTSNWSIAASNFEVGKKYVLRYKIKKTAGTLKNIAGHSGAATQHLFTIDGKPSTIPYHLAGTARSNITDDTNEHIVEFEFTYNGNQSDNNIYIQPNRLYTDSVTVELSDVTLYEVISETENKTYNSEYLSTELQIPTKTGYTYNGWYKNASVTGTKLTVSDKFTTDKATFTNERIAGSIGYVYGMWQANTYTITYNSQNLLTGLYNQGGAANMRGQYSINNNVVTVTGRGADGYVYTTAKAYLEANKTYKFSCTTNGTWGSTDGTVEAYLMLNLTPTYTYDSHIRLTSANCEFTPTTTGIYTLRLDVNKNGQTNTFTNPSINYIETKTLTYGNTLGTLPTLQNRGYSLKGWYTATSGGTLVTASTPVPAAHTTYYAQWTPTNYTITLNPNGGTYNGSTSNSTITSTYNTAVNLGYPTRTGYTFVQWKTSDSSLVDKNILTNATAPAFSSPSTNAAGGWRTASTDAATGGARTVINVTDAPIPGITKGFQMVGNGKSTDVAQDSVPVTSGQKYTISVWAKGTGTLYLQAGQSTYAGRSFTMSNVSTWTKYSWTFTAGTDGSVANGLTNIYFGNHGATGTMQICGMKLESGYGFTSNYWDKNATATTLTAEWTANTYTVTYNANNFSTVNKTNSGLTVTYNQSTSILTINGTYTGTNSYNFNKLANQSYADGDKINITLTYQSGSYTTTAGNPTFVMDLQKNNANYSPRTSGTHFRNVTLPNSGTATGSLTIGSSTTDATGLNFWLYQNTTSGATFTDYQVKVNVTKETKASIAYGSKYSGFPANPTRVGSMFKGWYTAETGGTQVTTSTDMTTASNHTIYAHFTNSNYVQYDTNSHVVVGEYDKLNDAFADARVNHTIKALTSTITENTVAELKDTNYYNTQMCMSNTGANLIFDTGDSYIQYLAGGTNFIKLSNRLNLTITGNGTIFAPSTEVINANPNFGTQANLVIDGNVTISNPSGKAINLVYYFAEVKSGTFSTQGICVDATYNSMVTITGGTFTSYGATAVNAGTQSTAIIGKADGTGTSATPVVKGRKATANQGSGVNSYVRVYNGTFMQSSGSFNNSNYTETYENGYYVIRVEGSTTGQLFSVVNPGTEMQSLSENELLSNSKELLDTENNSSKAMSVGDDDSIESAEKTTGESTSVEDKPNETKEENSVNNVSSDESADNKDTENIENTETKTNAKTVENTQSVVEAQRIDNEEDNTEEEGEDVSENSSEDSSKEENNLNVKTTETDKEQAIIKEDETEE